MIPKRLRLYVAGMVAFLLGMPLSDKVFALSDEAIRSSSWGGGFDIAGAAISLGLSIADVAEGSS